MNGSSLERRPSLDFKSLSKSSVWFMKILLWICGLFHIFLAFVELPFSNYVFIRFMEAFYWLFYAEVLYWLDLENNNMPSNWSSKNYALG